MSRLKKKKICFVINSRANFGRVNVLLKELKKFKNCELQIVLGASSLLYKFGDISELLKKDKIKVNHKFYSIIEGENLLTMTKSAGYTIAELSNIFDQMNPDVVVVLADRFENLPVAICASYMNIPLAHIQGGEITGSIDEKVRHAITKLSDIHFTSTERSKKFVIRMGENSKMVFNTGCPSIDLVKKINDKLPLNELSKFGVGSKLNKSDKYLVVMQHPVTTEINSTTSQIEETIKAIKIISKDFNLKILWFWPNVDAGNDKISKILRKYRENENPDNLIFIKNLPPKLFIQLLKGCECMIGNSSSGIREGSFIGVPYVNIGNRQDGREKCKNVISVRCNSTEIIKAVKKQISKGFYKSNNLYGRGNSSDKIAKLLLKLPLTYVKKINYI
mgnify:FL=1